MEIYILLGILVVFLIVAYICYRMSFYNTNRYEDPFYYPDDFISEEGRKLLHNLIISFQEIPYEEVIITSNDGLKLYGRYYHVKDGAPIQIQLHGFHGNAYRDFCGGNKLAREKGFNSCNSICFFLSSFILNIFYNCIVIIIYISGSNFEQCII